MKEFIAGAISTQPDEDEIENLSNAIKLNGKTIKGWKADCETYYQEK